jgi:hypothetical protein
MLVDDRSSDCLGEERRIRTVIVALLLGGGRATPLSMTINMTLLTEGSTINHRFDQVIAQHVSHF